MALELELQDPIHWTIRDSQGLSTGLTPTTTPLPEYSSIVTFNSNIIGVTIEVAGAPATWKFGGWMWQKISLPFGANDTHSTLNYRKLFLGRKQLFIFPSHLPPYKLGAQFPKWFKNATVRVWEYLGPQVDSVEEKLDTLLLQHPP